MKKKLLLIIIVLSLGFVFANISFADSNDGLVAHYLFSGDATDVTGNGHNGVVNGASPTLDRFNNANSAFYFDGVDDYIEVSNHADLQLSTFTVSAWIKHEENTSSGSTILLMGRAGTDSPGNNINYWLTLEKDLAPQFGFEDTGGVNYEVKLDPIDNEWHLITGTYDGSIINYYLDGDLTGSLVTNATPETNNHNLYFGRNLNWSGDIFKGAIDDIRIYDRALSGGEIQQLAIVPEPISSTLFLIGGAALGFRRMRKRI